MTHILHRFRYWTLALILSAFLVALLWSKDQDPCQRIKFTLKISSGKETSGMAVVPRLPVKYPVAVYLYNSGSSLLTCGTQLRQIAELGLAAIAIEYDQETQSTFNGQFLALHQFLQKQPWAKTNVAWISSGIGAQRAMTFAVSGTNPQPELFIAISGGSSSALDEALKLHSPQAMPTNAGGQSGSFATGSGSALKCPVLLLYSQDDTLFPTNVCAKLVTQLRSAGASIQVCPLAGQSHSPDLDYPSVLRAISEYCATRLPPPDYADKLISPVGEAKELVPFNRALQRSGYQQPALWNAVSKLPATQRPPAMKLIGALPDESLAGITPGELNQLCGIKQTALRKYWPTAGLLAVTLLLLWGVRRTLASLMAFLSAHSQSRVLRLTAFALVLMAATAMIINLILPRLETNELRLRMANKFLAQTRLEDSMFLARSANAQAINLGKLLENVQLATLQRKQFYTNLDDEIFQRYLLSPQIDASPAEWNWRRILYENFQPRIRKERDPLAAAIIVVEYLRERVGVESSFRSGNRIETAWMQQLTSGAGFQKLQVAALRSVGIAARLNDLSQAELWTGKEWQPAPAPHTLYLAPASN